MNFFFVLYYDSTEKSLENDWKFLHIVVHSLVYHDIILQKAKKQNGSDAYKSVKNA